MHVTLCSEHIKLNETRIDDYKRLNKDFTNMKLYQLTSYIKKPAETAVYKLVGVEGGGRRSRLVVFLM